MTQTGGCLCGHIRFTAKGLPENPHSCSCHMCQRHSGAPTLVWVSYPKSAVVWDGPGGAPALWRSSQASQRAFCPVCGSTLGAVDDAPTIGLVTGCFDRPNLMALAPVTHSYTGSRPKWWRFGAGSRLIGQASGSGGNTRDTAALDCGHHEHDGKGSGAGAKG